MIDLKKEVQFIKGVGPNRASLLKRLGINTLEDLITYFPRGYEDRGKPKKIMELADGEEALIEGVVVTKISEHIIRKNMKIYKLMVGDETGRCQMTWFNQSYLKNKFTVGKKYKFFGKVSNKLGRIEMNSPVFDDINIDKNTGKIIPIYPLTYNLSQNTIRQVIENGMDLIKNSGGFEETLPDYLIKDYNLYSLNKAMEQIHFPDDFKNYEAARKRLVFEELLSMQMALIGLKNKYTKDIKGIKFDKDVKISTVINDLPFKLTKAQLNVLEEIDKDMEEQKSMNRLLQGDVGSRKNCCIYDSNI